MRIGACLCLQARNKTIDNKENMLRRPFAADVMAVEVT
jgi:hypothetical protein